MKILVSLIAAALISGPAHAQEPAAAPAVTLVAGSAVTPEALAEADWVRGEVLREWEPGKLYLLECWATWCGPCIAVIPHVNHLHKTYTEKGLRVIGMNVWEDGRDKVEAFVKGRGEGMSYPVAYVGRGGDFENDWLKPAGVRGIPRAFLVRDGKMLFHTHPSRLTDEVIAHLLEGGEEAVQKVLEGIAAEEQAREKMGQASRAFRQALQTKDDEAMTRLLGELREAGVDAGQLAAMKTDRAIALGLWEEALESFRGLPEGPALLSVLMSNLPQLIAEESGESAAFRKEFAGKLPGLAAAFRAPNVPLLVMMARFQWQAGMREEALASAAAAHQASETEGDAPAQGTRLPKEAVARFHEALKAGTLPTVEEFREWSRPE